mmetsp:Transcript_9695/g.28628  ORF Transcript_9695/g.28628 Transcript_9695/m.28628 type:complete len:237 (+) Transcript_9695:2639-3349(+)
MRCHQRPTSPGTSNCPLWPISPRKARASSSHPFRDGNRSGFSKCSSHCRCTRCSASPAPRPIVPAQTVAGAPPGAVLATPWKAWGPSSRCPSSLPREAALHASCWGSSSSNRLTSPCLKKAVPPAKGQPGPSLFSCRRLSRSAGQVLSLARSEWYSWCSPKMAGSAGSDGSAGSAEVSLLELRLLGPAGGSAVLSAWPQNQVWLKESVCSSPSSLLLSLYSRVFEPSFVALGVRPR